MALRTTVIGLSISMPLVATLFLGLRIYTRMRLKRLKLDVDDYLVVAALVFCYIMSVCVLIAVFLGGVGNGIEFDLAGKLLHPQAYRVCAKTIWVMDIAFYASLGLSKLSILFFYKKIFAISRRFRVTAWIAIVLIIVGTIGFTFSSIFVCVPIEQNWSLDIFELESPRCVDKVKLFWAGSLSDILTDVFILALPWPEIWGLHMSVARRVQIAVVFMLGYFVLGADIARLVLSLPAVQSPHVHHAYNHTRAPIMNWKVVEANVSLICACLPTLRPILIHVRIILETSHTPVCGSHPPSMSRPRLVHSNTSPAEPHPPRPPPRPIFIRSISAGV